MASPKVLAILGERMADMASSGPSSPGMIRLADLGEACLMEVFSLKCVPNVEVTAVVGELRAVGSTSYRWTGCSFPPPRSRKMMSCTHLVRVLGE